MIEMGKKHQTKVGYIAIYYTDDYGGRILDDSSGTIYENAQDCQDDCVDEKSFIAVATVTWEE